MANNYTAMEMPYAWYEDPLSQPPWSTIIKVSFQPGLFCGNHFKLIQSQAAADISLCLVDLLILAAYAYYSYDSDVISSAIDLNQIPGSLRYSMISERRYSFEFIIKTCTCNNMFSSPCLFGLPRGETVRSYMYM